MRRGGEAQAIDRAISDYYDNLTDEEKRELRDWGNFAAEQLRKRSLARRHSTIPLSPRRDPARE